MFKVSDLNVSEYNMVSSFLNKNMFLSNQSQGVPASPVKLSCMSQCKVRNTTPSAEILLKGRVCG